MLGTQVLVQDLGTTKQYFTIDLSNLTEGVYLIRAINAANKEISKGKFIKNTK